MKIEISHDLTAQAQALEAYPEILRRNVLAMLDRGALAVRDEAARLAPKAFTTLTESIKVRVTGEFERTVEPDRADDPDMNYAEYVERGTGPAIGRGRYMPDPETLMAYIKRVSGIRLSGKRGSPKRARQDQEVHDRAWALARYIYWHGTKPHPYMAPAAANKASRVKQLLAQGVANAAAEAFKA